MSTAESTQCQALIGDGERCSRSAQEDGFCYQHDENDPTVDEATDADVDEGTNEASDDGSTSETAVNTDGSIDLDDPDAENEQSEGESSSDEGSDGQNTSIREVRNAAEAIGRELIGGEPDGITGISRTDDGWQVTLEVVERSAIPDTQDILGRYEVDIDSDHSASGYRRLERYRRGDTNRSDVIE